MEESRETQPSIYNPTFTIVGRIRFYAYWRIATQQFIKCSYAFLSPPDRAFLWRNGAVFSESPDAACMIRGADQSVGLYCIMEPGVVHQSLPMYNIVQEKMTIELEGGNLSHPNFEPCSSRFSNRANDNNVHDVLGVECSSRQ